LGREALAMRPRGEHPRCLGRPVERDREVALEVGDAGLADEAAGGALAHQPDAEACHRPVTDVTQQAGPDLLAAGHLRAQVARDLGVGPHRDTVVEILGAMAAQRQSFGLEGRHARRHGARIVARSGYAVIAGDLPRGRRAVVATWSRVGATGSDSRTAIEVLLAVAVYSGEPMNKLIWIVVVAGISSTTASADKVFRNGKGATWDCKQDPVVNIDHGNGTYAFKGSCETINLNGGHNTLVVETSATLNVIGGDNKVAINAVDAINLIGSNNTVT